MDVKTTVSTMLAIGLLLAACTSPDTGSPATTSPSTSRATDSASTAPAPTEGSTTSSSAVASGDTCELLAESDLLVIFPDGVDAGVASESQGGSSCTWGPADGNLMVTVWSGEEFYTDFGQPLDLGDEASMDVSTFQASAIVRFGGETVLVSATGLDVDEDEIVRLTEVVVGGM